MITPRLGEYGGTAHRHRGCHRVPAAAIGLPHEGNSPSKSAAATFTSYVGIMREFARQRGLRRWIVRVPFLSLSLSSRWLTLITPVYASIGPLPHRKRAPSERGAESQRRQGVFAVRPMGISAAIERALANEEPGPARRPAGPTPKRRP